LGRQQGACEPPPRTLVPARGGGSPPTATLSGSTRAGPVPWAELLRRVFTADVLLCPCGGCRSVVAVVVDSALARAVLAALGSRAPPATFVPARDPAQAELWFDNALVARATPDPLWRRGRGRTDPDHRTLAYITNIRRRSPAHRSRSGGVPRGCTEAPPLVCPCHFYDPGDPADVVTLAGSPSGRILFVVTTVRGDRIRLINARTATRPKRRRYEQE
jgi:hypothetical protein